MTTNEALELMKHPRDGDSCLICGGAAAVIGVFLPDEPAAYGGVEDKTRLIRYCLCQRCCNDSETPEKVEKVLRSELRKGGAI